MIMQSALASFVCQKATRHMPSCLAGRNFRCSTVSFDGVSQLVLYGSLHPIYKLAILISVSSLKESCNAFDKTSIKFLPSLVRK